MVFLRELAQNARDAGARRIGVGTTLRGGELSISFGDDGSGMTFDHASEYLFTLYASSKEEEARSAGRFGVGFWSVLLLDPDATVIESMTDDGEAWAVSVDRALSDIKRIPCALRSKGTRVTLRRRVTEEEGQRTLIEVDRALRRYCRYLRRNDKRATPLPVYLNRVRIDEPFRGDGPCWMTFRDGSIEGVVGLGLRPRVDLYACGLLVWRGTAIDELRYGATPVEEPKHAEGLTPTYAINGNDLTVTLDRRAVVDDRGLARVRRVARRRMRELVGRYLDSVSPRPLCERLADALAALWEEVRIGGHVGPIAAFVAVLVLAMVGGLIAVNASRSGPTGEGAAVAGSGQPPAHGAPELSGAVAARSFLGAASGFEGPMVQELGSEPRLGLAYTPPVETAFRVALAERLHAGRGIVGDPPEEVEPARPYRCAAGCVDAAVEVRAGPGIVSVPTPTGHRVEAARLRLEGRPAGPLLVTSAGQAAVRFDRPAAGILQYRTGPAGEHLTPARREALLEVPSDMVVPPLFRPLIRRALSEPAVEERVRLVRAFVEGGFAYDRTPLTVSAHRAFLGGAPSSGWLEFATNLGRGDCDVKNAIAVVMLRRAGVPARLAVGYAGREGLALPGMHAWIEYYDAAWIAADATGRGESPTPVSDSPQASSEPSSAAAERALAETGADAPERRVAGGAQWMAIAAVAAAVVAALSGLLGFVLLVTTKRGRRFVAPGGLDRRKRVAAEMLRNAVGHPRMWSSGSGLATRRLLPVIGNGRRMSLGEAKSLARSGRLWRSSGKSSLVRRAVSSGARILDSSDEAFGRVVELVPGCIDLDEISRLRPQRPESLPPDLAGAGRLIAEVDRLLGLAGRAEGTVLPCLGFDEAPSRDVDLSGLRLGAASRWPARFVAVSPHHPETRRRVELSRRDLTLAGFLLLDMLLERSDLLAPDGRWIRARAAREVLEVSP